MSKEERLVAEASSAATCKTDSRIKRGETQESARKSAS